MKSIGEHLKTAREEKGFSFDQVVHDTNISREYIHALEEDNFDFFPAEAYLIGFLRNYSEYLGLDPSKMVGIYKNYKISEEPVPMDLLLGKKQTSPEKKIRKDELEISGKSFSPWLIPALVAIVLIVVLSIVFLPSVIKRDRGGDPDIEVVEKNNPEPEDQGPKEFFLTEETLDITVSDGDQIKVSTGSKLVSFSVRIAENEKFLLYRDMDNLQKEIALKKDVEQGILIEENRGIYFYIKDVTGSSVTLIAQKVMIDNAEMVDEITTESGESDVAEEVVTSAERIVEKSVISLEDYPQAYTVDVFFRGDGLLRHKNDDQPAIEKFYQAGERLKIDVNRTVTLWASNAGIVELKISGKEISIGENGQVVVRSVKWIKNNETGKYELIITPVN